MEVIGNEYTLVIKGIFGRNRKVKQEFLKIERFSENVISDSSLEQRAQEILRNLNPKSGLTWYVSRNDAIKKDLDGSIFIISKITFGENDIRVKGTV